MKKGSQQQKTTVGTYRFRTRILYKSFENVHGAQARATRRGPPGSTIIIDKEVITPNDNNNHYPTIPWNGFSRQGAPLGEGFLPHSVGGIDGPKSFLLSPYPAIPPYVVRTLHPGLTDDRENITSQNESRLASTSFIDPYMSAMRRGCRCEGKLPRVHQFIKIASQFRKVILMLT